LGSRSTARATGLARKGRIPVKEPGRGSEGDAPANDEASGHAKGSAGHAKGPAGHAYRIRWAKLKVDTLAAVRDDLAVGTDIACALFDTSDLYCWGDNRLASSGPLDRARSEQAAKGAGRRSAPGWRGWSGAWPGSR
jgi:hypothetical protein